MTRLLLEKGSNVNCVDIDGATPLHYAATADSEELVRVLLENGARRDIGDADGSRPVDYSEHETIKSLLQ